MIFFSHYWQQPITLVTYVLVVLLAIIIHEYGHAIAAISQGDPTPKNAQGRFIWNPLHYLNPIGLLMFFLLGFGLLGFVKIKPTRFRHPIWSGVFVAIAGVLMNLLLALICLGILYLVNAKYYSANCEGAIVVKENFSKVYGTCLTHSGISSLFIFSLQQAVYINLILFFFNLLIAPGLDGAKIFYFLFRKLARKINKSKWFFKNQYLILIFTFNFGGLFTAIMAELTYRFLFKTFLQ